MYVYLQPSKNNFIKIELSDETEFITAPNFISSIEETITLSNKKTNTKISKNNFTLIKKKFFKQVPNVIRYRYGMGMPIKQGNPLILDSKYPDEKFTKNIKKTTRKIIIVLESPHVDEFSYGKNKKGVLNNIKAIAPAQGRTGKQIYNNLGNLFNQINCSLADIKPKESQFEVILINPIPYQTSLSTLTSDKINMTLRDKVWKALWFNETNLQQNFSTLLKGFSKNDIIINACTKVLKSYPQEIIKKYFSGYKFEANHPCTPGDWTESLTSIVYETTQK
ncbi:hypothetical protein [Brochothrix thermosphacta]|uniref:hypothetical protein n=1 Tax=Brochothrix thermosphacta TaxID=2756 RepID=UPI00083FADE3|nr:hypothetical protein [Brochothrix thermosphacta]ODJ59877.1 hypothetical protein BFR44_02185 [Brochothrix thermosphacta]